MSPRRDQTGARFNALLDTLPADDWTREQRKQIPAPLMIEIWHLFVGKRHGLTPVDIWGRHGHPRTGLSKARRAELWMDPLWRAWVEKILAIEVSLRPGGRALSREREDDATFSVEIQWFRGDGGLPMAASVLITPDWHLAFNQDIDLDAHMIACRLRLAKDAPKRARLPQRPRPGEARDLSFYRRLLQDYDGLMQKASPAPARELADLYGVNHSTVKSWLKRGRDYLRQEEK